MATTVALASLAVITLLSTIVLVVFEYPGKAAFSMWLTGTCAACASGSAFHYGFLLAGTLGTLFTFFCIGLSIYMLIEFACNDKTALESAV